MKLFCVRIVADLWLQELKYDVDVLFQAILLFVCVCCSVYSAYGFVYLAFSGATIERESFVSNIFVQNAMT